VVVVVVVVVVVTTGCFDWLRTTPVLAPAITTKVAAMMPSGRMRGKRRA
jgi:hypothetical protein